MAAPRICSIPGCAKRHEARGWCACHYERWRTSGDPLVACTTPGEPLQYFRESVLTYDGDACLSWPYAKSDGRGVIRLNKRNHYVHRLVCEHAYGPPPSPEHEAAHSCGNGHNGCVAQKHLRWATHQENMSDRVIHGTSNRGSRSPVAKLTEENVRAIRALKGKMTQKEIGAMFGVTQGAISYIHCGRGWTEAPDNRGGS
jgi:hypothetical protein